MPKVVIHGSFGRHFQQIKRAHKAFTQAGFEVIAPSDKEIVGSNQGFLLFEGEEALDPRYVELQYLHKLKQLGTDGFSYFVNPRGYMGKSVAYELGIAQLTNTQCYFWDEPEDLPAYVMPNTVWKPEELMSHFLQTGSLPRPKVRRNEKLINRLWLDLMVPGSSVAAGGIIEYRGKKLPEVLLVKTHKWGHRYSIVGGKVRRNELLKDAYRREIKEETNLNATIKQHICTFDQLKNSGYYQPIHHVFVDYVAEVKSKRVALNDEAQDYIWVPANIALAELEIEPNARHTLELYAGIT